MKKKEILKLKETSDLFDQKIKSPQEMLINTVFVPMREVNELFANREALEIDIEEKNQRKEDIK